MKKLLAAIVAVAMILSLAIMAPVSAETKDPGATFSAETVTAEPGETITVTASIAGEYECHGLTMEFNYDDSVLTLDSYTLGSVLGSLPMGGMALPDNSISGSFRVGVMCAMDGFTAEGELFTCTFTVADDAAAGNYPIEFVITAFTNMPVGGDATDIPYEVENGAVVVEGEVPPTEVPPTEVPPTEVPPTEVPPTEVPPTEVPPTEVPPTEVPPTEVPPTEVPPTEVPPTEVPPTEVPPTEVPPTEQPTDQPTPPPTGAITLIGLGVAALATAGGVVIFRRKED